MAKYRYRDLSEANAIRLLKLSASTDAETPLAGEFIDTPLKEAPSFEAISYVWGELPFSAVFYLKGTEDEIAITPHLASALGAIRHTTTDRIVWVDGLCINQSDDLEKANQVSLMANIYQAASGVLAWMGDEHDRMGYAFTMLESQQDGPDISGKTEGTSSTTAQRLNINDAKTWELVDLVLTDVWFTRLWIVQESVLAKKLMLLCGTKAMSWEQFDRAMDYVLSKKPRQIRLSKMAMQGVRYIGHVNNARRDFAMQSGARQRIDTLNMSNWISSTPSIFPGGLLQGLGQGGRQVIINQNRGSHFSDMFWSFKSRNCKDDRDRVYAMLGFLPWDINIKIKPNYSFTPKRVYTDFARAMYELHYVELLVYAGLWDRVPVAEDLQSEECPSWVPELRPSKLVSGQTNAWDHPNLDYVIKNIEQPRIEWLSFYKIQIEGHIFDKIKNIKEYQGIEANEGLIYAVRFYFNALVDMHPKGTPFETILRDVGKLLGILPYPELGSDGREDAEDLDRLTTLLLADAHQLLAVFDDGQRRYHENTLPPEQEVVLGKMFDLTLFLRKRLSNRRMFITEQGRCGLAPSMGEPGDSLVRFLGQPVECLIRRVPTSQEWCLIGPCYYHAVIGLESPPTMITLV